MQVNKVRGRKQGTEDHRAGQGVTKMTEVKAGTALRGCISKGLGG